MRAYTIFDDFTDEASHILEKANITLIKHPEGIPRPSHDEMKSILESYECVILGTSQKITEDHFNNISSPRIIGTASVGIDHIHIPEDKKHFVTVINAPKANAQSVAEYTLACALSCCKRLNEGAALFKKGLNNKALFQKPEDLNGKTMGVVGAGNISVRIMDYALMMGMKVLCWTRHPEKHAVLKEKGIVFFEKLDDLIPQADYISVNLPNIKDTVGLISSDLVCKMKNTAVFISVSRLETVDVRALLKKASEYPSFYVCLDLDVSESVVKMLPSLPNVIVTPHIAGGTVETRKRLFRECAENIVDYIADHRAQFI